MASDTATDRYYLIEAIQSIFSYLIGLAAIFYSFVVDHAAGIMAFCGVVALRWCAHCEQVASCLGP